MQYQNFINNEFITVTTGATLELISPVTEESLGHSPISGAAEIEAAIAAASEAFKTWSTTTPAQRQKCLLQLADAIDANAEAIAQIQTRETGQITNFVISEECHAGADHVRFFAGAARLLNGLSTGEYLEGHTSSIRRESIGVIAQVTPWNYPLMMAI